MTTRTSPGTGKRKQVPARKRALLICNGKFKFRPDELIGVRMDYQTMTEVLGRQDIGDFEVEGLLERGLVEVRTAIARVCRESADEDTLLIYYSGSSFKGDDGNFYLPVADSDKDYPDAGAIDSEFMLSCLRNSRSRRIILLIDGCHSGGFFENNRGIPDGMYAITACAADQSTLDTPNGGMFTQALIEGMQQAATDVDGDGFISIDELHDFVKKKFTDQALDSTPQKWVWNVRDQIHIAKAQARVFLSYCREDVKVAKKLQEALQGNQVPVWLDLEGIRSGDWRDRVTKGLNQARAMVFLMTTTSLKADAVKNELTFAAEKGVPIIPVVAGTLAKIELPDWYLLEYGKVHCHELSGTINKIRVKGLVQAIRECRR